MDGCVLGRHGRPHVQRARALGGRRAPRRRTGNAVGIITSTASRGSLHDERSLADGVRRRHPGGGHR